MASLGDVGVEFGDLALGWDGMGGLDGLSICKVQYDMRLSGGERGLAGGKSGKDGRIEEGGRGSRCSKEQRKRIEEKGKRRRRR